jgi:hypothetical protein
VFIVLGLNRRYCRGGTPWPPHDRIMQRWGRPTECRPYNDALHDLHSLRRRALRVPHAEQRMYIVRENQLVMNALTPSITIRTAAFSKKSLTVFYSSRMMSLPAFIPGLKRPVKHRPGVSGSQLILDVGIRLTATRWM